MDQATISILVQAAGLAIIAWLQKMADAKMDEAKADTDRKREAEAEWRDSIDRRLDNIEDRQSRAIAAQAAQIRSDIVHKCHRYLDDLGKASTEEKESLHDEHEQYSQFCYDLNLENNFIDNLVKRVMALPER